MALASPLLKNDYLTQEVVAKSLYAANPLPHVTTENALRPSLSREYQVEVKQGLAWVGGTDVEVVGSEYDKVPNNVGSEGMLLVLRVQFSENKNPRLVWVKPKTYPNPWLWTEPDTESWYQVPGKTMDMPVAYVYRSGASNHLVDCRVIREGGSYRLAQLSAQVKFSLLPPGTLTNNDNQIYTPYTDGLWLKQLTIPEDGRSWMGIPDTMLTKAKGLGLSFCMPGRRVELKGVIVAQAGAGLVLPENLEPFGEFFDLGYETSATGVPTPVFAKHKTGDDWAIVDKDGKPLKGETSITVTAAYVRKVLK